jgi:hypothetical protein
LPTPELSESLKRPRQPRLLFAVQSIVINVNTLLNGNVAT